MFYREKQTEKKTFWKCSLYKKYKCGGRVHVENDEVVKSYEHNHVPDNAQVELKELMYNMKHDAQTSAATSHGVIGNLASQVPLSVAGQLPSVASLKRTIQRARRTKLNAPVNPLNFSFDIPEDFTKTKNGDDFLLFDNKSDTKRILLFSTKNSLELMNNCLNWFCDGTFTCSPIPFKQLYTIHAVHYSNVIPSAYALLPDKKEDTYIQMFKALKSLNQNLNPKSIMMDFEKAAMNAVKSEFPNTSINGCFFHLSQCIWRHLQEAGLQKNYIQDSEFALHIRMLPALAFVPQNKVIKDYEKLLDSEYFSENEELLMTIIDYFEGTWIGRLHRRGQRRDPIIPISVWNCYDLVAADLPRTNNSVEGWHNCFSSTLNSSKHPSIWRFIHALQKEESINTLKIQHHSEAASNYMFIQAQEQVKKMRHRRFPGQPLDIGQLAVSLNDPRNTIYASTVQNPPSRFFQQTLVVNGRSVGVIFANMDAIDKYREELATVTLIGIDGTFKTVPHVPADLKCFFTIQVVFKSFPMVYALLGNYEKALMSAVQQSFPESQLRCCFFSFYTVNCTILCHRKMNSVLDLVGANPEAARVIRMVLALPHLPVTRNDPRCPFSMADGFMAIMDYAIQFPAIERGMRNFLIGYVEYFWLLHDGPELISVFGEEYRTNNYLESFHATLLTQMHRHPNIWNFLREFLQYMDMSVHVASLSYMFVFIYNIECMSYVKHLRRWSDRSICVHLQILVVLLFCTKNKRFSDDIRIFLINILSQHHLNILPYRPTENVQRNEH
ncbi:hypothetical protein QTP88_008898 [Uroleucon formosanum]